MTAPHTHPAERETPAGEARREAVAPTDGALKLTRKEGGATGELCERIAWALDPEAFQIWEREHERKREGSGPTWDQLAVSGRRQRARATAADLVSGPIASELAHLRADRDEAQADWAAQRDHYLETAASLREAESAIADLLCDVRDRDAANTTLRADHATEVARKDEEIARLKSTLIEIRDFPENYDKDGRSWAVGYAFYAVQCRARAALATTEMGCLVPAPAISPSEG